MRKRTEAVTVDKDADEGDMQESDDEKAPPGGSQQQGAKKPKKGQGNEAASEAVAMCLANSRKQHLAFDKVLREGNLCVDSASKHRLTKDRARKHNTK